MSKPIVSVIIPIYNEEKYIDRSMGSIEKQTYKNLQIILVDGGSEDGSHDKCDEWARRWNNESHMGIVEVIHTQNKGVSFSRNKGLSHAYGEYVFFLDGDDWIEPDLIERMVDAMTEKSADLVGCGFVSRYSDEDNQDPVYSGDDRIYTSEEYIDDAFLNGDVHCWGRLYKKSILGMQTFREGMTIGEDMIFLLEYILKCQSIASLHYEGYNYYRNPNGAMWKKFTPKALDQVNCWQEAGKLLGVYDSDNENITRLTRIQSHVLISIMLSAGRIAFLDKKERVTYTNPRISEKGEVLLRLKEELSHNLTFSSWKLLDRGYRFKVILFAIMPRTYMSMYHMHRPKEA